MASAFAHAFSAYAIGKAGFSKRQSVKFWFLGMMCAVIPDADVIGFKYGVPYGSMLGHRGLTHSILFAVLFGMLVATVFYGKKIKVGTWKWTKLSLYFIVCTVSHGILDAMTTGGKGVAFFAPFNNERIFFSFRPIRVSPLGWEQFFGEWGIRVLKSEMIWVGIPCLLLILLTGVFRYVRGTDKTAI